LDGEHIRRTVLEVVRDFGARPDSYLQSAAVLQESAKRLGIRGIEQEQALLTFFGDLFRIGYLAWGFNLSNPAPPFCHITDRGRRALAALSRDPSNPDGYLANLRAIGRLNPVSESYIREALATYAAGCFKATAVMVGAAAESVVLELRDVLVARLDTLGKLGLLTLTIGASSESSIPLRACSSPRKVPCHVLCLRRSSPIGLRSLNKFELQGTLLDTPPISILLRSTQYKHRFSSFPSS